MCFFFTCQEQQQSSQKLEPFSLMNLLRHERPSVRVPLNDVEVMSPHPKMDHSPKRPLKAAVHHVHYQNSGAGGFFER